MRKAATVAIGPTTQGWLNAILGWSSPRFHVRGRRTAMGKRLMITVEQNGERLKDTEADIDRDEDIARVVKAVLDDVRWEDRSRPLGGIVIRIDEISP